MMYRQGDVLIERVKSIPKEVKPAPRAERGWVLAYGEVTGHAHVVIGDGVEMYEDEAGTLWLSSPKPSNVVHEEHGTIPLDPGAYKVTRQREWTDSDEPRMVAD